MACAMFWRQETAKMENKALKLYVKMQMLRSRFLSEEGQDLIEYALVVSLIALAATAGMSTVATKIGTAFTNIGNKLATYTS
jgi:pilus assembly protein Flp/PilA